MLEPAGLVYFVSQSKRRRQGKYDQRDFAAKDRCPPAPAARHPSDHSLRGRLSLPAALPEPAGSPVAGEVAGAVIQGRDVMRAGLSLAVLWLLPVAGASPAQAARARPPRISYLDNGHVRVGVN